MAEGKNTQLPKDCLSFSWRLFKSWWSLVPVGLLTAYGTISSWIEKFGSVEQKTWWAGLLRSRFGWQTLLIAILLSALGVAIARSHQILLEQAEEIAGLKQAQNRESWLQLFDIQRSLEQEIAALEMNMPTITVRPQIKVGKDIHDFAQDEIERKKKYLKQIIDRMKELG